ncbi:MAG: transposase [Candidatus Omnitrophota bacterium]
MGRSLRIHRPGLIYHVINRGNNQQAIFLEDDDYERYLGVVYRFKKAYEFDLYAYCLMTNHIHLLIKVSETANISKIMQSITLAHTKHYHFKYHSSGHVWQGRFKSPIVSNDDYLLDVMGYIERNPVKAGMVLSVENYRWSSYLLNVRIKHSKLIDRNRNEVFLKLGSNDEERIKAYRCAMSQGIKQDRIDKLERSIAGGGHYISEKFAKQIQEMLPRKRRRGRPGKNLILTDYQ